MNDEANHATIKELLKQLSASSHGLPNLPAMAGFWDTQEFSVAVSPGAWAQIVPPDVSRWYLLMGLPNGAGFQWSTMPDDVLANGFFQQNGNKEFKYKDNGTFISNSFYAFDKGGSPTISVVTINLRLRSQS